MKDLKNADLDTLIKAINKLDKRIKTLENIVNFLQNNRDFVIGPGLFPKKIGPRQTPKSPWSPLKPRIIGKVEKPPKIFYTYGGKFR